MYAHVLDGHVGFAIGLELYYRGYPRFGDILMCFGMNVQFRCR